MFLNMLIRIRKPHRILEIGSANGYSTIWMAEAAKHVGGHIVSIDYSRPTFAECKANILEAGFKDTVELIYGDALQVIPAMPTDLRFDMAFVDGRKSSYLNFWNALLPKLGENPVVVFDDILAFSKKTESLTKALALQTEYDSIILPIDGNDGILLLTKQI